MGHIDKSFAAENAAWDRRTEALRALARRLLADEHAVEDAVQETWVRTLDRGPERDGAGTDERPRRWMETVLRNVVRDRHRRGARRAARESAAARDE